MTLLEPLWDHIHDCDRCSAVDLDLCTEGERIKADALQRMTSSIAPMPKEPVKA